MSLNNETPQPYYPNFQQNTPSDYDQNNTNQFQPIPNYQETKYINAPLLNQPPPITNNQ